MMERLYQYFYTITIPILLFSGTYFNGKVVGVKDGDTIEVLYGKEIRVIRLAHIDCPERRQPFNAKAKQLTSTLCFGKKVRVYHESKLDRNKRYIAEIIVEDTLNVNKRLVQAGLAWHYKKYSNNPQYSHLESAARKAKRGLWQDPKPIAPWEWRKLSKAARDQHLKAY